MMGVGVAPGNAQLVVTWTAVDTATGYTAQWTSGGEDYNTGDRQATVTSGSTTRYTIPSLTNGTAYTVRVIATRTGATDGPPSEEMTGTPRVPPPPPPPPVTDLAQVMGPHDSSRVGVLAPARALPRSWRRPAPRARRAPAGLLPFHSAAPGVEVRARDQDAGDAGRSGEPALGVARHLHGGRSHATYLCGRRARVRDRPAHGI